MKLASWALKFLCFVTISTPALAKDLSGRLGVGLSNIGSRSTEAFSIDWQSTRATSFEINLGLDTQKNEGGWELGFRASRNLFIEDNLLFSIFVGASLLQQKTTTGTANTGYMVETGLGSKFFLQGLPNLGLGFRGAFQLSDITSMRLAVVPVFSVHYYF